MTAATPRPGRNFHVVILVCALATNAAAQTRSAPLTSAAIDASIFREGEVQRTTNTHAAWTVVCDEIARLKQRFCSLRTPIKHASGELAAVLTVSTGQDGRPAAMLKIASALVASGHVALTPIAAETPVTAAARQKPKPLPTSRIKPLTCDKGACTLIWTLTADQIAALNAGAGIRIVATPAADLSSLATLAPGKQAVPKTTELTISPNGFAAAVATSMRAFE